VKFDSFPFVQYGLAEGSVRTISADSFSGGEETQRMSVINQAAPGVMYYKARIKIEELNMHDVPGGFHLKPGMPVTTDIRVGERTLLMYLFARVLPVGLEGMREP
jgi:multidrug efflux pump subunit AcrA (membrane-fusion protein)